jgi:aminopeptidase YwaD
MPKWVARWSPLLLAVVAVRTNAQDRAPLLADSVIETLATELSGDRAHETVREIATQHRMRGSKGFRAAADLIVAKAKAAGLDDARVEEFPADGKIFYGTQRSRPPWDAEFAELWDLNRDGSKRILVASWEEQPMSLAQDSESGEATGDLVDVGSGRAESDYAGKNVRGKLILTSSQPEAVVPLGVAKYGAAGIVSYAQNQRTAWWGENTGLVRWGHLDTFSPTPAFAFMISPAAATAFKARLANGERITLDAKVRAGKHPGAYSIATAAIRGTDSTAGEIVFSCHLDHPNPGANDNASGCATILEVGSTLSRLIKSGRLARPARTMRFVWPPEIEGTVTILNAKRAWASSIKAVVHMDMVGGGAETKAVFHVSSGPGSLPSFVYDVGHAFAAWVNDQTYRYAATGSAKYPLISSKGSKSPLRAELAEFTMGSDHQVYTDASWGIPAIYLHDWPDRYIHTTWDTPDKIDPTKLMRAAFIGAASGYALASLSLPDTTALNGVKTLGALRRQIRMNERLVGLDSVEANNLRRFYSFYESSADVSLTRFFSSKWMSPREMWPPSRELAEAKAGFLFMRNLRVLGPVSVFGYDYLSDKLGAERTSKLRLLQYQGLRGSGGEYAYEVANLAHLAFSAKEVRDMVSAIYGPVPLELVEEYLKALESIGIVFQNVWSAYDSSPKPFGDSTRSLH